MLELSDRNVAALRRVLEQPDSNGRYHPVREIARGGMGVVWEADDRELGRRVALKILPFGAASADWLCREARVLAGLEHPGIVPVHDAGLLADGRAFYAMKLVQGNRLDQAVAGLTRNQRLRIFQRICEPVEFAHSRGIIHRDLKPENVMVGEFGEVLVMDWGLALAFEDSVPQAHHRSKAKDLAGSPAYMAPELAQVRTHELGPATDVYLLGAILHEVLTGKPPHDGDRLVDVLRAA